MKRIALALVTAALLGAASYGQETHPPAEPGTVEHGTAGAGQKTHHEKTEPDMTGWKVANFVLLAGLIGFFIYKKAGGFYSARSAEIRQGLDEAARAKEEAEARYLEIDERLANIGRDVEALREQARREARAESQRAKCETERELKKVQAQAGQEIASAAKVARQELRTYAAELAVGLAAQKIQQRLTPDAEAAIVSVVMKDLEQHNTRAVRAS